MNKQWPSSNCEQFATIKKTGPRKIIFEIIFKSKVPLSAKDIFNCAKNKSDIWLSSVYRTLNIFLREGIISKSVLPSGECVFEMRSGEHSHFAVCTRCKRKTKINVCPLSNLSPQQLDGFRPQEHKIEIYGLCKECSLFYPQKESTGTQHFPQ
jgi:Fur family ferric uptake transcriptional regulator